MSSELIHTKAVVLEHLTKSFGNLVAVDDLTLEIFSGEILGFLGPNGAGKSTSINMICGLLKPDSGQVFIKGNKQKNGKDIFSKIGLCPQDIICWPKLTCLEQLVFVGNMYGMQDSSAKESAKILLDRLGLSEQRNRLAQTLSGGMKRRLNLALALVHNPEIIILDEPEAGLDPQSRLMVREFIREMSVEKTVILTSHNMDEVDRLAKRVAIIDHGKLLLTDTPENLKKSIGEGDILEIELLVSGDLDKKVQKLLQSVSLDLKMMNNTVIVRSVNAVNLIPEICSLLQNNNIAYGNIRLRGNTLEDVFIHLTGRRLRE
ncbi:MAG TPA: ABC transporter ATP-binding protein [Bacteroidales bacterium]|nr:ABC transporter ATP-binding protein [Bacteroidales bacterium]